MSYANIEASAAEGRPYFLYQFVEGEQVRRFTSRAEIWTSAGSGGTEILWEPAAVAHGDVVQTSEIERGRLELTWPLSHPFARRFLAPLGNTPVTLTLFRGHEQVLGETVAHWKGRVVGAEVEGPRILLTCESRLQHAAPRGCAGQVPAPLPSRALRARLWPRYSTFLAKWHGDGRRRQRGHDP
ncbi:hypothetical protein [Paracoccus sp. (in: a-proteobacteria)]|uniref:hypothetical protein n=1 Tax=Paracoccus sp. TaxID=267 RepID=UPI002AFFB945|nr:hypothetical protein [Paracoccus sp. (in: a-proteobacteria)]